MSSLITQIVLGNGLVMMCAIALPLIARKSRASANGWGADAVATSLAVLITAAIGIGALQLVMAVGSIQGLLRYGYVAGEIAACFMVFSFSWLALGPGRSAKGKFRLPPGPVAHH